MAVLRFYGEKRRFRSFKVLDPPLCKLATSDF